MIVVSSGSRYRTLSDLLDEARAKPGEVTMASIGPGTGSHIAFEMLVRVANIKMTFVPYPGTAPAVGALLGEHVTSAFADYPTAAEHVKARCLRALAVASPARIASLPDVPTVTGYGLHEALPDHSSLTRIRQRWGDDRFRKIFKRTVEACLKAKIVTADVATSMRRSSEPM